MRQRKQRLRGPFRVRLKHIEPELTSFDSVLNCPPDVVPGDPVLGDVVLGDVVLADVAPQRVAPVSVGLLGRCDRSDALFRLPDGIRSVSWDYSSRRLPRAHLSAVVLEDRLLILPIHESFLDGSYRQVEVDQSVWNFLGINHGPGCP